MSLSTNSFPSNQNENHLKTYQGGWFSWNPYQYLSVPGDVGSLTGLDIDFSRIIFKKIGSNVSIQNISWKEHQLKIRTGEVDYGVGAFNSEERFQYAYFSVPYRFEENSFFSLNHNHRAYLKGENITQFIKDVQVKNLKIGIVDGYLYGSKELNGFINNPLHDRYFQKSPTDYQNLILLLAGKIDGFLSDRIVGSALIFHENAVNKVIEQRLDSRGSIHFLLSKKSFSLQNVQAINHAIEEVKNSNEYIDIVSRHIYPVLLLEITSSRWFELIQTVGIIAFALSGLILAYHYNTSFFGTFIIALIPSFGGGILRDVIFGRYPIWFISAKIYMITLLFIVIGGFFTIKFGRTFIKNIFYNKLKFIKYSPRKIFETLVVITDALGLAVFTVVGVVVCLMVKADPLWLWGPFFAFLSGAGGTILRDIILKEERVEVLHGAPYGEITIIWGSIFSFYLAYTAHDIDPFKIKIMVIFIIICAFLSRLLVYFFRIPNVFFIKSTPKYFKD